MPVYEYHCTNQSCGEFEFVVAHICPVHQRDYQRCTQCEMPLTRHLSAPTFKIWGRVTPGGGMDKLTADQLKIPVRDLPAVLRQNYKEGDEKKSLSELNKEQGL
jgi:hypothetical protein